MTILFLSRLFYPHIGGVEKHVLAVGETLVKNGNRVIVVTEKFGNNQKIKEKIKGIEIYRIPVNTSEKRKKFLIWKWFLKNRFLIKETDLVHAHDVFFWYLPFRFLFPSKRIFTTFHGYEGNKIPGFKSRLMHKIAEKLSKGNICVGEFLTKWYGTKPDYITYGAVKIPNSKSRAAGTASGVARQIPNKYKILFLGRLEEETGIMDYLKALKILKQKKYKFKIIILGDGHLRKIAEKFSKANNIDAEFKGFVEEVQNYLEDADFVFVSRYLGILEALSHKKFVFAHYDNLIKKDYLETSPFSKFISINSNDKELSLSIEYFLKNQSKNNQKIIKGFNWVQSQSWDKIITMYLKLWSKN